MLHKPVYLFSAEDCIIKRIFSNILLNLYIIQHKHHNLDALPDLTQSIKYKLREQLKIPGITRLEITGKNGNLVRERLYNITPGTNQFKDIRVPLLRHYT